MRKVKNIVFLVIISFFGILSANAFSCEYSDYGIVVEYDDAGTPTITQTKYENSKTPIILNWYVNKQSGEINTINSIKTLEKEYLEKGYCPQSIYACAYEYSGTGNFSFGGLGNLIAQEATLYHEEKSIYLFSSENEMKENATLGSLPNNEKVSGNELWDDVKAGYVWATKDTKNGWTIAGGILSSIGTGIYGAAKTVVTPSTINYSKYKDCGIIDYTGKRLTFNLACPNLQIYKDRFSESVKKYEDCNKKDAVCISKTVTEVNNQESIIKSYCKSLLAELDFDGGTESECLKDCIDIGIKIKNIKKEAGLISGDSGECGFSARLLVWTSNILRWIKYILPVIVIVMGIIDFIKAIAADKEDEMKKAQGAFVKRLIAAALVFIIPLIIEFILDKMGFGYNDCGLF